MPTPRVCVLRAPGTNCDPETAHAFQMAGGNADAVHLFRVLEQPKSLDDYQILCVPGGFSYGDDLGSGVVFASQLRAHLGDVISRFLTADKLVLGICNGFQVLVKAGVLPDGAESWSADASKSPTATLTWNENGRYTARWVRLKVGSSTNVFLRGLDEIDLPIAHAEGRLVAQDTDVVTRWEQRGQTALRYIPWQRSPMGHGPSWPTNPNGSVADLAGLGDPTGRVLGLMPHPERFLFGTQHPQWTRRPISAEGDGLRLFQNAIRYFQ
jgi:phosphoribosylformylglycinamidine synthase subunit PurQ / glutaminase